MKTLLLTTALAAASLLTGPSPAQADHFYGGCNRGYGYSAFNYGHVHHGVSPWVNPGYGHYDWHDTSHYDYVAPRLVPHYNHYHYQPGGYILHQTGHWDLHH